MFAQVAPTPASLWVTLWPVWSMLMSAVCIIYRLGFLRLSAHRGSQDCGTTIANGGAPTPPSDCSMVCSGNSSEFCGGPYRLTVYNNTGTVLPSRGRGGDV